MTTKTNTSFTPDNTEGYDADDLATLNFRYVEAGGPDLEPGSDEEKALRERILDGFEVICEEEAMDRVVMTNPCLGLVRMQVCVVEGATDDEILEVANRVNPSGTTNGWCVVLREEEPVRCEEYPERIHLLLEC